MKLSGLLCLVLFATTVFADEAYIINEGAYVYTKPDFDSEHRAELHENTPVEVSKRAFGPFHRIRLRNGKMGFIADNDYRLGKAKIVENRSAQKREKKIRKRPYALTRFRGFNYSWVNYRESTFGLQPTASTNFYGFTMYGPDVLIEGDMVSEINFEISPGAPSYYQQATGNGASGWILHMDALVESVFQQTSRVTTFMGFGPMFRYSHYDVALTTTAGHSNSYSLDDMVLGVVLNAGFGIRIGSASLRGEYKFNWEKMQYWGLGASLGFPF